jgi:glucose-1-phosphate cytidylyltransferase
MVEIGEKPILWHIMKMYSAHGVNDFIVCLGYKGYLIKEYFANYFLHTADVKLDLRNNQMEILQNWSEPWHITLVETGSNTQTGGRLKAIKPYLSASEPFCMTYGDGVSDIDMSVLIAFHSAHGKQVTITAVAPPGRFGALEFDGDFVTSFREKPAGDGGLINGGFFVVQPQALDLIDDSSTIWEREPLERLARKRELVAYRHDGFWHPMDTLRDKLYLEQLWQTNPPWRKW